MKTFYLGLLLFVSAVLYCVFHFQVSTSITHFLPQDTDHRLAFISREVATSEIVRTIVLTIGSPDEQISRVATSQLAEKLRKSPHVAWVQNGVSRDLQASIYALYFPRRFSFLSHRPEDELPHFLSDEGLEKSAKTLKKKLGLPTGSLFRSIASRDPILAFDRTLERLKQSQRGTLRLQDGQFMTSKEDRGVILLGSRAQAFDSSGQRELQVEISRFFSKVNQDYQGVLDIAQSGAGRFAIASEEAIKKDIKRISIISTLGIVLLFLLVFRSIRSLGLMLLPLASGILGGTTICLLLFGKLHGITLAFGSTLIGVCIDYAVHFQCHHALAPHQDGPSGTLRRIFPALFLGAVTTIAGLAGLAWTTLPGIREIALFASFGVGTALGATYLFLPPLMASKNSSDFTNTKSSYPLLEGLSSQLFRGLLSIRNGAIFFTILPVISLVICLVSFPMMKWSDNISDFQNLDPDILEEDNRIRQQVSQMEAGRFIIALGQNEEEALQNNDRVFYQLKAAQESGIIGEFKSLHELLWSVKLQQRNVDIIRKSPQLFHRTQKALQAQGFRQDLFEPFNKDLQKLKAGDGKHVSPLKYSDLLESPLGDMVRSFKISVGNEVAILTFLKDVRDPVALQHQLASMSEGNELIYFDQFDFLSTTYRNCRTRTIELMFVGLCAVFLMVLVRYRRLILALAAFVPALLAGATTLALVTLTGQPANLLHLLGLLLVLSMGVDYGVFMVESRDDNQELAATLAGLLIACISTVCAFGLLALSDNPALKAMGLTTGIGVFLSFLLSPMAFIFIRKAQ